MSAPAAKPSSRKSNKKVDASGSGTDIPVFDANILEIPPDSTSDLNPQSGRGKHPAEGAPDSTVRPPKRASRVVQYVVSSDEEDAGELARTGATVAGDVMPEINAERRTAAVSPPRTEAIDPSAPSLLLLLNLLL